jgi:D-tagatose-1,6-bisphosphate aldolase subunit GatZ/KbaZ
MVAKPSDWEKYYTGSGKEKAFKRKYSYSDRWRYYAGEPAVRREIEKLFASLDSTDIPLGIISQYLPVQYERIRNGSLQPKARAMAKDKVKEIIEKYCRASGLI